MLFSSGLSAHQQGIPPFLPPSPSLIPTSQSELPTTSSGRAPPPSRPPLKLGWALGRVEISGLGERVAMFTAQHARVKHAQ